MSFQSLFGDVGELIGRNMGRGSDGPKYEGEIPSDDFFVAARRGDPSALNSLVDEHYRLPWRSPFLRDSVEAEMRRGASRGMFSKAIPRGLLTGYPLYGAGRAASTLKGSAWKAGIMWGAVPFTALGMATAPRGQMVNAGLKVIGGTIGGQLGAAAGGALLGLPGEIIGGVVGGEIGEKAVALFEYATSAKAQGRYLNFNSGFSDNEQTYTMRQRAVQEMGRSALNARQWLGKESVLMHQ